MADGSEIRVTVFLKRQQDTNLGEINAKLDAAGYRKQFPPERVGVALW